METLKQVEAAWKQSDVIVINLPVAAGKSPLAVTIARWAHAELGLKSSIITPTKILVEQYLRDFPQMHVLRKKDSYYCQLDNRKETTCADFKQKMKRHCKDCPYVKALRRSHVVPYAVYNYYIYLAHRLYNPVLIADEAHNLLSMLRDFAAKKIWDPPKEVCTYSDFLSWLEEWDSPEAETLREAFLRKEPKYLVQKAVDSYRGEERECLKLLPIDVKDNPPLLWPGGKVNKLILLSATIGPPDIEALGLSTRRIKYINAVSPISPERRPILLSNIANLSYSTQDQEIPKLVNHIRKRLSERKDKGFIHITYDLAHKIRPHLQNESRLIWHEKENKMEQYQNFYDSPVEEGKVMVASGLYEGVDLLGDLGRWQLLTKVPWPSLAEPAVRYKAERNPDWYNWETAKLVLQASGRICRREDDYGLTEIVDQSFGRLLDSAKEMFPLWWRRAIVNI